MEPPRDDAPRSLTERVERGDLGAAAGKGFFDYGDSPLEEILAARDDALLDAFAAARELEAAGPRIGGAAS